MASEESDRPYFWTKDADELRRAFIIDVMSDADIAGEVLVANMQHVFDWLKDGKCPAKARLKRDSEDLALLRFAKPKKGVTVYASCEDEAFFLWRH